MWISEDDRAAGESISNHREALRSQLENAECLVVGGGMHGAAFAHAYARNGGRNLVIADPLELGEQAFNYFDNMGLESLRSRAGQDFSLLDAEDPKDKLIDSPNNDLFPIGELRKQFSRLETDSSQRVSAVLKKIEYQDDKPGTLPTLTFSLGELYNEVEIIRARTVLAIGLGNPHIPTKIQELNAQKIVHSSEFDVRQIGKSPEYPTDGKYAVIGGGESAGLIFLALMDKLTNAGSARLLSRNRIKTGPLEIDPNLELEDVIQLGWSSSVPAAVYERARSQGIMTEATYSRVNKLVRDEANSTNQGRINQKKSELSRQRLSARQIEESLARFCKKHIPPIADQKRIGENVKGRRLDDLIDAETIVIACTGFQDPWKSELFSGLRRDEDRKVDFVNQRAPHLSVNPEIFPLGRAAEMPHDLDINDIMSPMLRTLAGLPYTAKVAEYLAKKSK